MALIPFFSLVMNQMARDQSHVGFRVPSKVVPAVTDLMMAAGAFLNTSINRKHMSLSY